MPFSRNPHFDRNRNFRGFTVLMLWNYHSSVSSILTLMLDKLSPTLLISFITFLEDRVEVWTDFGRSASCSRNSRKSGSVRKIGWAAVRFIKRSKAALRRSTNWKNTKVGFKSFKVDKPVAHIAISDQAWNWKGISFCSLPRLVCRRHLWRFWL